MVAERPEVELLLCCARTRRSAGQTARIRSLARMGVDWELLLRMAGRHGMLPLLLWHLDAVCPEDVPGPVLGRLRDYVRANNLHNLSLTRELLRILGAFEGHGIGVVPYKGPILTIAAYGNLGLREFGDLDLVVRKRDVSRARELLTSLGYREEPGLTAEQEDAFLESQREYVFVREDGESVVELHWAIMPKHFSFELDTEDVWDRLERTRINGTTVLAFSTEDALLILCAHGSKHFWHRLAWICDVAESICAHEKIDWEELEERAGAIGAKRMLFLGLFLANDLLGTGLPEQVVRKIYADPAIAALARQVRRWIVQGSEETAGILAKGELEESRFHPFRIKIRERFQDKVRYCVSTALTPTTEDWALLPLPRYLFPLYYVLRPARLTQRYGRRLLGRIV